MDPTGEAGTAGGDGGSASSESRLSTSGTRLLREVWTGGGASIFRSFVDTARGNARCSFMAAEDGVLRCLPLSHGTAQYLDANCAQLVSAGPAPTDQPRDDLLVPAGPACDGRTAVYSLGAPIAAPPARYQRTDAGACEPADALPDGWQIRPTTAKVSATSFVDGERRVEGAAGRLRRRLVASVDVAWFPKSEIQLARRNMRSSRGKGPAPPLGSWALDGE